MVTVHEKEPSKWAALCKDYNPIHMSIVAARLFGFPGKIAYGNQAAAMMVESLASTPRSLSEYLWLDSRRLSFMEVDFRRPVVVPVQLLTKTTDDAAPPKSEESDETLLTANKQVTAWAAEGWLPNKVRQAAKVHHKQVYDVTDFQAQSKNAIMAGCIFIANRDRNVPRTFSEIHGFTQVPEEELDLIYKPFQRFFSSANDEIFLSFRLGGKNKVFVDGRVGWLGQR